MNIEKIYIQYSDEECWKLLKEGCKKALATLYFRYYDKLYSYAMGFCRDHEISEDQIQALFLNIWEKKTSLGEVTYVKTYLWVSLRRNLMEEKGKERRMRENVTDLADRDFNFVSSPEEILISEEFNREQLVSLYKAIQHLKAREKEVLYLKFFEGMSYQEIEEITSLKYQSVRNYIYEAVKTLKIVLQNKNRDQKISIKERTVIQMLSLFVISL